MKTEKNIGLSVKVRRMRGLADYKYNAKLKSKTKAIKIT